MNNNNFNPNPFKDIKKLMENPFLPPQFKGMFDFKKLFKYILIISLMIFMSGFGVGLMIGLLF